MEKIYIHNYEGLISSALKRIDKKVGKKNQTLIHRFIDDMYSKGNTPANILARLSWLETLNRLLKKDFERVTEADMKKLFADIERGKVKTKRGTKYSSNSILTLKKFSRFFWKTYFRAKATPDNPQGYPPSVKWIDLSSSMKAVREQMPEHRISEEEILEILKCANNQRDRALFFFLYESMGRIGEVLTLKIGDFEFQKDHAVVTLNGKTGQRKVIIVESVPDIRKWLEKGHPDSKNSEAFIWRNMASNSTGEMISYGKTTLKLKRYSKIAGISRPIHPHLFRGTRATHLLMRPKEISQEMVRRQGGWSAGSKEFYRYVKLVPKDVEDGIKNLNGMENGVEKLWLFKPKKCEKCKVLNSCIDDVCHWCTFPLSQEIIQEFKKEQLEDLEDVKKEMSIIKKMLLFQRNKNERYMNVEDISFKDNVIRETFREKMPIEEFIRELRKINGGGSDKDLIKNLPKIINKEIKRMNKKCIPEWERPFWLREIDKKY